MVRVLVELGAHQGGYAETRFLEGFLVETFLERFYFSKKMLGIILRKHLVRALVRTRVLRREGPRRRRLEGRNMPIRKVLPPPHAPQRAIPRELIRNHMRN